MRQKSVQWFPLSALFFFWMPLHFGTSVAKHIELILKIFNSYIALSLRNNLICVSWQRCTSWIRVDKIFSSVRLVGVVRFRSLGESSFNMTRGEWRYWGGLWKFLDTRKGGSENLYTSKSTGGGGSYKIEPLATGAAKISSFEFQYLHPPLCHIKWTFPSERVSKHFW